MYMWVYMISKYIHRCVYKYYNTLHIDPSSSLQQNKVNELHANLDCLYKTIEIFFITKLNVGDNQSVIEGNILN